MFLMRYICPTSTWAVLDLDCAPFWSLISCTYWGAVLATMLRHSTLFYVALMSCVGLT